MKRAPIEAYPLCWPEGQKRTPVNAMRRNWNFYKGTLDKHRRNLLDELRKLGASDVIISTNMKLRSDGQISASQSESMDCAVAVYFTWKDRLMCFACDQFTSVRENI